MHPLQMTFFFSNVLCVYRWGGGWVCVWRGGGGGSILLSIHFYIFYFDATLQDGIRLRKKMRATKTNSFLHLAVTHYAMPASFHPKATFCIITWWYTYSIFEQLTFAVIQQRAILRQNGLIVATFILSSFWYRNKLSTVQVNMVIALYICISN